jgi:hypothetical protein
LTDRILGGDNNQNDEEEDEQIFTLVAILDSQTAAAADALLPLISVKIHSFYLLPE